MGSCESSNSHASCERELSSVKGLRPKGPLDFGLKMPFFPARDVDPEDNTKIKISLENAGTSRVKIIT